MEIPKHFDDQFRIQLTSYLDKDEPIFIVGEGNFTFTTSLAALRGSWDNLHSTKLSGDVPTVDSTKILTSQTAIQNNKERETAEVILQRISSILNLPPTLPIPWESGIDAAKMNLDIGQYHSVKNVWFQCPWRHPGNTDELLKEFIERFSQIQQAGQKLIIGIVANVVYYYRYELEKIFGPEDDSFINKHGYEYLGFDGELIKNILKNGYRHHSDSGGDLHVILFDNHITIVLKKITNPENSKEQEDVKNLEEQQEELKLPSSPNSETNFQESSTSEPQTQ
uniref:25S rRNA (uridine-N(3))-methyltransferase BMT5-like domain-containing protein n=1 Tax=Panagrolaimus sp. JU765 TaxID=591449 RepID=A0AC34RHH5_9BILA